MKKALSAECLFHFTPELEYLISILKTGISPRFCIEDISYYSPSNNNKEIGIPMSCFCDIPLSSIHEHASKYGSYGIGLTKNWAQDNGISPVMYIHKKSFPSKLLRDLFIGVHNERYKLKEQHIHEIAGPINAFWTYFKAIEGKMFKNGSWSSNDFYFYDENEWRYTPITSMGTAKSLGLPLRPTLFKNEFLDEAFVAKQNELLSKHCSLDFKITDIEYIFVQHESEIDSIVDLIHDKYLKNQNEVSNNYLYGRVFSLDRLIKTI